jgi:putative radical SAM enzyme (TIGR03279 family)
MSGLLIESITEGGIASEMGIEPGDRIISINGHVLRDIIDYHYWNDGDHLLIEIEKPDGSLWECDIEGGDENSLGIVIPAPKPAHCKNKCIFCFVHQLPKGLRKTLYVKDEDYRLSFIYGNYVTLANVSKSDLLRIKKQRLSPLYISVHATDPVLREELLGKQGITPIMEVMADLAASGIKMHTQIVLCPGINDGDAFKKTVADLVALYPQVASIAIVPVGLTSHRKGLAVVEPVTAAYAASFINELEPEMKRLAKKLGEPVLFLADEFYLKANVPFPAMSLYGDFPQLENGVGMIPLFRQEAMKVLKKTRKLGEGKAIIVTGFSAYNELDQFLSELAAKTGLSLDVVAVKNNLFGPSVTVTGLVAGRDIIKALDGAESGALIVIPDVMLKEGEGVFLDDLTTGDIERALNVRTLIVESSPQGLYAALKRQFLKKGNKNK